MNLYTFKLKYYLNVSNTWRIYLPPCGDNLIEQSHKICLVCVAYVKTFLLMHIMNDIMHACIQQMLVTIKQLINKLIIVPGLVPTSANIVWL